MRKIWNGMRPTLETAHPAADFAFVGVVGGADDASLFHPFNQTRRAVVADLQPALNETGSTPGLRMISATVFDHKDHRRRAFAKAPGAGVTPRQRPVPLRPLFDDGVLIIRALRFKIFNRLLHLGIRTRRPWTHDDTSPDMYSISPRPSKASAPASPKMVRLSMRLVT